MTRRCNLRCEYCSSYLDHEPEMSLRQIKQMLRKLKDHGVQHITFIGGEPFVHQHAVRTIRYAKHLGFSIAISTNGQLLSSLQKTLPYIDLFATAFFADQHVHERQRGVGTYHNVLKAISMSKKQHKKIITHFIISKETITCLEDTLNFAMKEGFFVSLQPRHKEFFSLTPTMKDDEIHLKSIQRIASHPALIHSRTYLKQLGEQGHIKFNDCPVFGHSAVISPSGNMGNCYDFMQGENGNEIGWEKAIAALSRPGCSTCRYGCHSEDGLLFKFTPDAIKNLVVKGL